MSREELEAMVRDAITQTGAQGAKDMGKVMKALIPMVGGRADGKLRERAGKKCAGITTWFSADGVLFTYNGAEQGAMETEPRPPDFFSG